MREKQLIGLPYDRKSHVETIIKQIEDKIIDKAIKNPNLYYYNEYSKDDFDKEFFKEKNIFSVLNSLSDKEIDNIYYDIKKQIDEIRNQESNLKGNEPTEISQFNLLLELINHLTINDLTMREVKLNKKNNLSELKNKLIYLIQNKKNLKKIFNDALIFKTKGLSKLEIDTLVDKLLEIALENGDLDELHESNFANPEHLKKLEEEEERKIERKQKEIEKALKYELKHFRIEEPPTKKSHEKRKIEYEAPEKIALKERSFFEKLAKAEIDKEEKDKAEKERKDKEELIQLENKIYNDILKEMATKEEITELENISTLEGHGLFDSLKSKLKQTAKNIANVFTNSSSPSLDRVEKSYYPLIITRIQIYRTPVQQVPLTLLKAISLGNFDYKSNFDKLYHLYCVLELANETKTGFLFQLTEKTPNIVWEDRKDLLSMASGAEQMIYSPSSLVRFGNMIEQLKKNMGSTLTEYTASQYNCQDYILNIIKATTQLENTTVPSNIYNFIYQDISKVLAPSSTTSKIANKVTDLSHVLNRIGHVVGIGTGINIDEPQIDISTKDKSKIDKIISKKLHF